MDALAPVDGLLSDLYAFTMLEGYLAEGMLDTAVFELFVRRLPAGRSFLVAAGLEQALADLERLRFDAADLAFLEQRIGLSPAALEYLAGFRFSGDVDAIPEGTIVFENEPLLRVIGPLPEAQLVETRLINALQLPTLVAAKAARCVLVAQGKQLVDFGLRRAHGLDAGLMAARAAYLAGFDGSSNVRAAQRFGIPVFGTMAHSYVQAHAREADALAAFARTQAGGAPLVLLIDTYDTLRAAKEVVALAPVLRRQGITVAAVRLDSGDLAELSREVRRVLDQGGLAETRIFASGNLDEHAIAHLVSGGAPIDGFGVGTKLTTSADAPYLDCAYKLEEYAGEPRRKRSSGKTTWPGRKQVHRFRDARGQLARDVVALEGELGEGEQLLRPVMRAGQRLLSAPSLEQVRERVRRGLLELAPAQRTLDGGEPYPVLISDRLRALAQRLDAQSSAP